MDRGGLAPSRCGHNCLVARKERLGALQLYKVRLCVMGNQQKEGVHYKLGELYAPVMKAAEVRLFMAIAAQNGLEVFKSDTKQAFLNGEKGEEKI